MDKPKSNLDFKLMSFTYRVRDFIFPRMKILKKVGIKQGFSVLDYGCGPGSYIVPLAELVTPSGQIYALDIHPLAVQAVQKIASKKQLTNVKTICSDCETELPESSIDVVLLYDVFHDLSEPDKVFSELHRILKPNGILSFSDHHMKEGEIVLDITKSGLFKLSVKGEKTYSFFAVR